MGYLIFFDTEFMEDGETIEPLSLGFVSEDGRQLYLVIADADTSQANPWVRENVLPYLRDVPTRAEVPRNEAGATILRWVQSVCGDYKPEFWADYGSYDWVLLCQLFGTMMDLPTGWPMFVNDIQQWATQLQIAEFPAQTGQEHNALADAHACRDRWDFLHDAWER